jgi:hypothetical protein
MRKGELEDAKFRRLKKKSHSRKSWKWRRKEQPQLGS